MSRHLAAYTLALLAVPGTATAQAEAAAHPAHPHASVPVVRVEVVDETPRFLRFYEAATREGAGPDRRWALWKAGYDFAALPPVPERDSLARAMLESAWPRYAAVLPRIRGGPDAMRPRPEPVLCSVAALLGADSVTVRMTTFVGALEGNAFFYASRGRLNFVMPVEPDSAWRENVMTHELAHAVHHRLAGFSEGWERSIARTLFAEGLAARASQALSPGKPDAAYLEHRDGWYAEAAPRHDAILRGIVPALRARDSGTVMRFTMGRGTTGVEREAYYAGWVVVGHLLEGGRSFPELARMGEDEITGVVEAALRELTEGGGR